MKDNSYHPKTRFQWLVSELPSVVQCGCQLSKETATCARDGAATSRAVKVG